MHRRKLAFTTRWLARRWLPYAGLKRAGAMLVVAVCKAAVLVATLEASAQVLEPSAAAGECAKVDMANPLQGTPSRASLLKQSPVRHLRRGLGIEHGCRQARAVMVARSDGHRLANGLCAPLRC
jgi:hypothetical protein